MSETGLERFHRQNEEMRTGIQTLPPRTQRHQDELRELVRMDHALPGRPLEHWVNACSPALRERLAAETLEQTLADARDGRND